MTQELTIRQQITAKLRVRFAALIIGASLSAVALYMAMTYQMNRHQLARSLEMSHRVLTQALETSDLNLATTYLRATVEQESFYMIELRDTLTHKSVLGPVTSDHRRYIELCGKTDMGSKYGVEIYACRRLLGFPEILSGFIILLTLSVVLFGGIRFINDELMDWSDKLSGVLDHLSSLGTDDLKEAEQNYRADVTQAKEVLDLRKRVVEILANSIKLIEHEATAKIATQVAHDIRSPLAALEVVSRNVAQLPEDKRILIRSAVGRIRDIANNLLDRHRAQASGTGVASEAASPQLLSSLIDPVVSEKRLQFRSQSRVEIELRLDASSYGHFAAVQAVEFKRLLSNLVNNAVEAFGEGSGTVSVGLSSRDGRALVSVQDNGKGIPPEVLATLGRRGETHGKAGGSGLGLYHAQTSAESCGGCPEITS